MEYIGVVKEFLVKSLYVINIIVLLEYICIYIYLLE